MNKQKSFTLIELLVVVAIIGLLAAITVGSITKARERARIAKNLEFSQNIFSSLGAFAVGVWNFEEINAENKVIDASNNENDVTVYGGATVEDGLAELGKALDLDGNDDYAIKNPINNFPTTEITAEFWMNSSDTSKNGTPISYAVSAHNNEFLIYNYSNFGIYIGTSSVGTGVSANDGRWHHIVVTWKSSDGSAKLYKDGVLVFSNSEPLSHNYSIESNGSLVIGQEQGSVGGGFAVNQAFLGLIDRVRIYGKALDSAEIEKLYAQGRD